MKTIKDVVTNNSNANEVPYFYEKKQQKIQYKRGKQNNRKNINILRDCLKIEVFVNHITM